jgi:hypothetical protein
MIELATHPPVGLLLDQAPVDILYGTDLGNVSRVTPAIHPMIGIGGTALNNTAAFTPQADTDEAYCAMLTAALRSPGQPSTRRPMRPSRRTSSRRHRRAGLDRPDVNTVDDRSPDKPGQSATPPIQKSKTPTRGSRSRSSRRRPPSGLWTPAHGLPR